MEAHVKLSYILTILLLILQTSQQCAYQRCCNISPCTASYCTQRTSQTWISSQNYALYQYTKLVLSNNQCKPCPYNCKICSTDSVCSQCYQGYYFVNNQCLLCDYKCKVCSVTNGIQRCSSCMDGTYLDDTSFSCKACPVGAKQCSSSTVIVQCLPGYLKSSNSLFCTPCPSNCISCPSSDAYCSSCSTGYYLSAGQCIQCNKSNCLTCIGVGANVYCTGCMSGYMVASGQCLQCPSNCKTCSSPSVCTQCKSDFYLQSGGCRSVSTLATNCDAYSSNSVCSACSTEYYLSNNKCFPCSVTCSACYGNHFGRCTECRDEANLFNQMCIIDPFPSKLITRKYYSLPGSKLLLSGGTIACSDQLYSGSSISITLNNLEAYKVQLTYRLYTELVGQQYIISLNTNSQTFSSTSVGYQLCNTSTLYADYRNNITFSSIALENTLVLSSSSALLHLSEIILTAHKCYPLCIQCSESQCFTCINQNLYTQDAYCVYVCSQGYYTYQTAKQCVKQCPSQTYLSLSTAQCLACVSPCYSCLTDVYCLSCIANNFLTHQNKCQQVCPYQYFGNTQTQQCQKCVGRCLQCIDGERCLSCKVGFLEGNSCVDVCTSLQKFADLETLSCQPCSSPCVVCQYQATRCLTCEPNYLFHNTTCLTLCPTGYFADSDQICQKCNYPCQGCISTNTNCIKCSDKYLLTATGSQGRCLTTCPDGYYEDNIALICSVCDTSCSICYQSATNCFQCADNFYLFGNKCVQECPDQYYESFNLCEPCQGFCYDCSNQTYCLSCQSNFLQNGSCIRASQCPTTHYADIQTLKCLICSSQCLSCQLLSTKCTSCSDSSQVLFNSACLSNCPSSYYYKDSGSCKQCQSPCVTCVNQTHCLSCQQGYKYSSTNNLCSSTCTVGTFFNTTLQDCSECQNSCMVCENEVFCYICNDGHYLHVTNPTLNENQCLQNCPDGYFANQLSCSVCLFPCVNCLNSITCLSCATGILYEGRCLSGCPDSTFKSGNQCLPCLGNCLTCYNTATKCLSCQQNFYLLSEDCIINCPLGTYAFLTVQKCEICPITCSQCVNSTYCTTCIANKTYLTTANQCSERCPSGYYGQLTTLTCKLCEQKCLTCSVSANNCLTCSNNFLLVKLSDDQFDCVSTCPANYYSQNQMCYQCVYPCLKCTNTVQCISCIDGMFYHAESHGCLLNCPLGTYYYTNNTLKQCKQCISPCQTCINKTYCISCQQSLLLYDGTCLNSCPEQYYQDAGGICNRCYGLCETCSGKYYCVTCHSGYAYDGFCYSACPPGTYANFQTKMCLPCTLPCLQCQGSSTYCKRCQFNNFAYKGTCQSTCPTGTYQSGEQCLSCSFPCIDCPDQFNCNQCIGGYLLYMRASCIANVDKCPNDLYKINSKQCVPVTWCPDNYFKDISSKTCSTSCPRQKYVNQGTRKCLDTCESDEYVGENMVCKNYRNEPPVSLMHMSGLAFIKSSVLNIVIVFNETQNWLQNSQSLYTIKNLDLSRRLLATSITSMKYKQISESQLALSITSMPSSCQINLPAHFVSSNSSSYNLQNPSFQINLPKFTPYTYQQVYTGSLLGQFSQGLSWFIIIFSIFFCFVNRVSDVYILWDTAQLLYLLVFLNIQYPPNLNSFLLGMSNMHFLFVPSIFTNVISEARNISYSPFLAYSYDCNFLRTAGRALFLVILILAIFLILKFIELLTTKVQRIQQKMKNYPKLKQSIFKGLLRFRWHHTSDVFFLTYDIVLLFAISELIQITKNPGNIFSNIMSGLCLILYILFPLFVGYKLHKHYPNIAKGRLVKNLQCFYRGIDKTNKFGVNLILLRYFRKLLYCIIIAVFSMQPLFALPILMFLSVIMALFIFINKPFRKRLSNIITIITQVCLVIFFVIVAIIQFLGSNASTNVALGWIACGFLSIMLFALVFQVFCKTLFFLEAQPKPQNKLKNQHNANQKLLDIANDKQLKEKFSEEYLRKKAGQFFYHIFPKLKKHIGMDESDDEFLGYEDGDSQNSQNNDEREKNWGFDDPQSQKKSDQFRHYAGSSSSQSGQLTQAMNTQNKAPAYLIRCVKQL